MESYSAPLVNPGISNDHFFRKRYTSAASLTVGILLFLLPFAELKCGSVTLAENTGIRIALGQKWRSIDMGKGSDVFNTINSGISDGKKEPLETPPNVFALVALAAAVFGLAFSLSYHKMRPVVGICASILAAMMLLAMMIQLKMLISSATRTKAFDSPYELGGIVKIQFTLWYFLSLFSFATAAFFSYQHHKIELKDAMENFMDFEFQRQEEKPFK
ncbi:MAG: hypothetical protein ABIT05_15165 [Chitinophagaceae bacterium]